MFAKPKIKSSFRIYTTPDRALILHDEREDRVIEGEIFARLAPLLDGTNTLATILQKVGDRAPSAQIFFVLQQLARGGILVEGEDQPEHVAAPLLERFSGWTRATVDRLASTSVSVRSLGGDFGEQLTSAIESNGMTVTGEGGDLTVVATDEYLRPEIEQINREALASGKPWMLVKPIGKALWIGPILQSGLTGCWQCLAKRLQINRQVENFIYKNRGKNRGDNQPSELIVTSRAFLPATIALASALVANELLKWMVAPEKSPVLGKISSFNVATRESQLHTLVQRPQCPACGQVPDAEASRARPPAFQSRIKKFKADGGHRVMTPQQTYDLYKHHVSSILGVVKELLPIYSPDIQLAPAYIAGHNFAMGVYNLVFLRESLRGASGGKGVSDIQAKVSGLCEAIERYSGNYDAADVPTVRGSYAELGSRAIHPNACMGFSEEQYEQRHIPHPVAPKSRCVLVPRRFDENQEISWTELWSLTHQEPRLIPSAFCYYGHPEFDATMSMFPDSNGASSGNGLEEAFVQGFMELVERDAVAIWFYNRIRRRGVDIDSFNMPYLDALRKFYDGLDRDLWVLDISSDLPISVFACVSPLRNQKSEDIILGFGAHFDPKIALLRAVTEVNQFLPTLMWKNADGSSSYMFGDELAKHWWRSARIEEQQYLLPDSERPPIRMNEIQDLSSDDLFEDVQTCLRLCHERGMEVSMLDQTRPDIGLSVVKVIVPELCHFWRRLGKKRLWQVPVEQGWLEEPNTPETCNPYTIFF